MKTKIALAFAAALVCSVASAQVFRCTDQATKKTTYSDAPCTDGKQIVRQRSTEEQLADVDRADLSRQRFLREQNTQVGRHPTAVSSQTPALPSKSDSQACKTAKHELSISSNIRTLSDNDKLMRVNASIAKVNAECSTNTKLMQESREDEPSNEAPPKPLHNTPTSITKCTGNRCFDNEGNSYVKKGDDFMWGANGKACHRSGNMWNCN